MLRIPSRLVPTFVVTLAALAPGAGAPRQEAAPDPRAALATMDWLAGSWSGSMWGGRFEAHYSTPEGGRILSYSRLVREEREAFFEFEVFEVRDGALHLQPFPRGQRAGDFRLTGLDAGARRAVFENPDKDYPTRVVYERRSERELRITLDDPHGGSAEVERFELSRADG